MCFDDSLNFISIEQLDESRNVWNSSVLAESLSIGVFKKGQQEGLVLSNQSKLPFQRMFTEELICSFIGLCNLR